jgi:virginiamycin B lyase
MVNRGELLGTCSPLSARLKPGSGALLTLAVAVLLCSPVVAQQFTTFPIPPGKLRPGCVVCDQEGNVWFSGVRITGIGKMSPTGSVTWFPLSRTNAEVCVGAAGADGSVWFTDAIAQTLGRVMPEGRIQEFPLTIKASPFWVVEGPAGRVWLGGAVHWQGQFLASFTFAQGFKVRTWASWGQVVSGALAPDGSLWLGRSDDNILEQVLPSGKTRGFMAEAPDLVAVAPDGVVWYTSINHTCVTARLQDGTVRRFELKSFLPTSLAVDHKGVVWLGGAGANSIVRITHWAHQTFVVPAPDAYSAGLAIAPDGAIWFLAIRDHLDTMCKFIPP